jgi:hypothetical protein
VALALVSVLFVAALIAALYLLRTRGDLGRRLAGAWDSAAKLESRLAAATAERDELASKVDRLTSANSRAADDVERQRERADELALQLEAATAERSAAPAAGEGPAAGAGSGRPGDDGGLWDLLLAHITRRWASVVGVPPANRHMATGAADQIAQALTREAERLREEVGVDVELTVDAPIEPADRVPFLLAAVELLGALASSAERVTIGLDGHLVLVGDGWVDMSGEVGAARDRAVAAGAKVDLAEPGPEQIRLEVMA